jgi:hypothetical protein
MGEMSYKIGDIDSRKLEMDERDYLADLPDLLCELAERVKELLNEDAVLDAVTVKIKVKGKWIELSLEHLRDLIEGFIVEIDGV